MFSAFFQYRYKLQFSQLKYLCVFFFFPASSSPSEICKHQQRESLLIRLHNILVVYNTAQGVSEVHSLDSWKQRMPHSQHLAGGEVEVVVIVLQRQQELSSPSSSIVRF